MTIKGTAGDDNLTGTSGNDAFNLTQGGNDTVHGLGGNDSFSFGATFTAADSVDGGDGADVLKLAGDYSAGIVFGAATLTNVETISLADGNSYRLTTNDATVAAGQSMTVDASALTGTNTLTFDGSAETNGTLGVRGGAGNDFFNMGAHLTAADRFDGGTGNDGLALAGDYNLAFGGSTIRDIADISFGGGHNYRFTENDNNVAAGATMTLIATSVSGSNTFYWNGVHESDGSFVLNAGSGNIAFAGGAGADTINMGANLTADDRIKGEGGNDLVTIGGADYTLAMGKPLLEGIHEVRMQGGFDYHITSGGGISTNDTQIWDASALSAGDTLSLNFNKETQGSVIVDGSAAATTIVGSQQGDDFDFSVTGQGGFTASDHINGEAGYDRLQLGGDYTGSHALTMTNTTIESIEEIDFDSGHSYNITTADKTVTAGGSLEVDAHWLGAGDSLTFNGSAETDAHFSMTPGAGNDVLTGGALGDTFELNAGGNDTVHGGGGGDFFDFSLPTFTAADSIDGGSGDDVLALEGDYSAGVVFGATTVTSVEHFSLYAGFNYNLTTNDATVAAGANLQVDGSLLGAGNSLTFNGAAETDGTFSITGGAGNDVITGGNHGDTIDFSKGGNDTFTGGAGADTIDMGAALTGADRINGGAGTDTLVLDGDYSAQVALQADTLIKIEHVNFAAGHSYNFTLAAPTESPTQGHVTFDASALGSGNALTLDASAMWNGTIHLTAGAGNDVIHGTNLSSFTGDQDSIDFSEGGNDTFVGGDTTASIAFGATLTAADRVTGGDGGAHVVLNGDYSGARALTLAAATLQNADLALDGAFNYDITLSTTGFYVEDDVTAGHTARVDATAATSAASFSGGVTGDTFIGGSQGDTFYTNLHLNTATGAIESWSGNGGDDIFKAGLNIANTTIDGGAGNDTLVLDQGGSAVFSATAMTSVETIQFSAFMNENWTFNYKTNDANLAAGQTLNVNLDNVQTGNSVTFDGSAETDGHFTFTDGGTTNVLIGGAQSDTFNLAQKVSVTATGGGGGDTFTVATASTTVFDTLVYNAVSDSTSANYDTVKHWNFTRDLLHVSPVVTVSAIDAAVTTGTLSTATFDSDLASAVGAAQLGVHHTMLFTASAGTLSGHTFLVVDVNGTAGYQAGADLVIDVTGAANALTTASFS